MPTVFTSLALLASLCFLLGLFFSERRKLAIIREQDREHDTMVALLSHRLRTPLTSVKWYTELLLNQEFGKLQIAQMELLNKVNTAISDSIGILNKFLETSQIERGDFVYKPSAIDVHEHLQRVLDTLKDRMEQKQQKLTVDPENGRMVAYVNPLVFHIIVEVLVSNAVNYTPANGSVSIRLTDEGNDIRIDVTDTGIGMTKAELGHLFTKFFRSDRSKTMYTSGNGLGLYLVKQMLEQIGGTIRCQSEEHKGTTFSITMPSAKNASASTE